MFMSTSHCSSAWPCLYTSGPSVIPEFASTTLASSVYSRFCFTAATPWGVGPPNKSTRLLTTFQLSPKTYGLNQLRYDLRKLKGHGLLERDGTRYVYRLTPKGVQVALLFLFFYKRLCGPLANSRFHHIPDPTRAPASKLELAYYKGDKAIQNIVDLLAAA